MYRPSIYENALKNNIVTTEDGEYLSILEWIEQKVRINRKFIVDIAYMKKILGPKFRNTSYDSIRQSLARILEKNGIGLKADNMSDGMKLTMYHLAK